MRIGKHETRPQLTHRMAVLGRNRDLKFFKTVFCKECSQIFYGYIYYKELPPPPVRKTIFKDDLAEKDEKIDINLLPRK